MILLHISITSLTPLLDLFPPAAEAAAAAAAAAEAVALAELELGFRRRSEEVGVGRVILGGTRDLEPEPGRPGMGGND